MFVISFKLQSKAIFCRLFSKILLAMFLRCNKSVRFQGTTVIISFEQWNASKAFDKSCRFFYLKNYLLVSRYIVLNRFPADVVTNQREITIQKRTLNPEIYQVKLEVSMKALGYSEADEAFLEISAEPLYVRIEGGSTRLMSWQEKIFFDGSSSYDPNVLQGNAKNFIYKWYCRVKPGSLHFVIGSGGCFGHGHNLIEHHEATWTVNEETFIRNAVYIVKLVVESRTSPERSGFFEQYVDIQAGTFMKTSIQ